MNNINNMKALILAGGFGTRISEETDLNVYFIPCQTYIIDG